MLRNLKFATKIGLLPALAGISFVAILAVLLVTGRQGLQLLVDIEQGYYASLELNRQLHEDLAKVQSAFQDSASMADPEYLEDAQAARDRFIATLANGKDNPVVDIEPLLRLEERFSDYFELSTSTIGAVIDGTADMGAFSTLQSLSGTHREMLDDIETLTSRDKQDVANAISTAQSRQKYATVTLATIAVTSLLLGIAVSTLIIRTASRSVRRTVDGINALASGDLSKEFEPTSGDEMGHMVGRVTHVTKTVNSVAIEIEGLIDSVRAGRLDARGEPDKFQGAYARLITNINELIEAFVAPIEVTANYVERISRGDMPPPIEDEYQGDFNRTKENLNLLIATMNGLIHQVATMTSAAKAGDLDQRGNPEEFSGAWRDLVNGINDTLDAVTEPLQEFSRAISAMAHGNLTYTNTGRYQGVFAALQDDIRLTVTKLTEVISGIKSSGDSAASVANDLYAGNSSLRKRTDAQASSLKEASRAMIDLTVAVKENAGSAQRAKDRVSEASEKAKKGGAVVDEAVGAICAINAASDRISAIINVIDEIAFQTNLLALNAAVEAARAGEEGKGFAVVASEVRNLAGRSATAAKEIHDLIQDSVTKVEEGSMLVHKSGQTLKEIVDAVIEVDEIVAKITESSQMQASKIDSVSESVAVMDSMTKENAELADAVVKSSDLMGEEAKRLNQMTAFFVTGPGHASETEETATEGDASVEVTADVSNSAA